VVKVVELEEEEVTVVEEVSVVVTIVQDADKGDK
jgi:hypothetical protein